MECMACEEILRGSDEGVMEFFCDPYSYSIVVGGQRVDLDAEGCELFRDGDLLRITLSDRAVVIPATAVALERCRETVRLVRRSCRALFPSCEMGAVCLERDGVSVVVDALVYISADGVSLSDYAAEYSVGDYLSVGYPHEGRIMVCDESGLYGFVDESGSLIVALKYAVAEDFREGRSVVRGDSGWGVIDLWGDVVVPLIYDSVGYDEDRGIIVARKGDLWYYLSYDGAEVSPPTADYQRDDISI